ncbi:hypothetical protein RhiirA5_439792 [Rhizophagus irregularis]|uniref:Uncharacterized protein n=1 Tax=Rhizophagus irregularis TaxID=588596 RepID=A0A2N0NHG7_9GLOM|nr:hypothetical protein RhiirA5_439792 [Rhizophagus irregularis]
MSPILGLGANNAIQDANKKEMLNRTSADVLKSRNVTFKTSTPLGPFGVIIRDNILKVINVNLESYAYTYIRLSRIKNKEIF